MIEGVNYVNNKSKFIKYNLETYKKLPSKYEDFLKLKGVGPKIALIYFKVAHNKTYGISIDTHCHRIPN